MSEPQWLSRPLVEAFHADQIQQHRGIGGIRDANLLESGLARAPQKFAYGERDLAHPAAAYAFGIARNHPFNDGNKRVAFVAAATFLRLNGFLLRTTQEQVVAEFLALAAGERDEEQIADWIRERMLRKDE